MPVVEKLMSTVGLDEEAILKLQSRLRGDLLLPGDVGYDEERAVCNATIDRLPAMILMCEGTADVIEAVRFAREYNLPVAVCGGGHNVAGMAVCDGGMMIKLSRMNSVIVDPEQRTALVAGGARWADVDHETQAFGLATPGGLVSDTGVAGLTLGGGLGWLRRPCVLS